MEDDPILSESLSERFKLEGFDVLHADSLKAARNILLSRSVDVVVSDMRVPDGTGADLVRWLRDEQANLVPVLAITAYGTIQDAVALIKLGANDYLEKPFDTALLIEKIKQWMPKKADAANDQSTLAVLGISGSMQALEKQLPRIAQRARTVLVTGESGTGKEVVAMLLHDLARGSEEQPFIAVNCGAIPEHLIEAAFFGHERGAFTGADKARRGYFEMANGGTLFLDEVGELTPDTQVRLLRVLQDRVVRRIGAEQAMPVQFRLVCATHRNLIEQVQSQRFREDLFYRINVLRIHVPPLRERPEDILWLTEVFLDEQARQMQEPARTLTHSARISLLEHDWPGNVRELQNRVERACVLSSRAQLTSSDLFDQVPSSEPSEELLPTLDEFVGQAEKTYLRTVLKRFGGKVGAAAQALGISRKTLWEKSKRYGLDNHEPES
jgi:DNA-binding NtrC family response regulator